MTNDIPTPAEFPTDFATALGTWCAVESIALACGAPPSGQKVDGNVVSYTVTLSVRPEDLKFLEEVQSAVFRLGSPEDCLAAVKKGREP